MFRSPAARIRCFAGSLWPTNADRSEMIRCAEESEQPTLQLLLAEGCGFNQRAYIETAMKASSSLPHGITLAAATVPMPLIPIASSPRSLIGGTCRYGLTVIQSESLTTSGHLSYNFRSQKTPYSYSTRSTRSPGGLPASCRSAKSAPPSRAIRTSSLHGFSRLSTFQLTTLIIQSP